MKGLGPLLLLLLLLGVRVDPVAGPLVTGQGGGEGPVVRQEAEVPARGQGPIEDGPGLGHVVSPEGVGCEGLPFTDRIIPPYGVQWRLSVPVRKLAHTLYLMLPFSHECEGRYPRMLWQSPHSNGRPTSCAHSSQT